MNYNYVYMSTNKSKYWSTYKIFLELLHLLLVAFQSAVVHGATLDRDLTDLQVHLLQLKHSKSSYFNKHFLLDNTYFSIFTTIKLSQI